MSHFLGYPDEDQTVLSRLLRQVTEARDNLSRTGRTAVAMVVFPSLTAIIHLLPKLALALANRTVYIAWCNDMILGVYGDAGMAQRHCDSYRTQYPGGEWEQLPSGRWHQRNGRIARLEVEEVRVR